MKRSFRRFLRSGWRKRLPATKPLALRTAGGTVQLESGIAQYEELAGVNFRLQHHAASKVFIRLIRKVDSFMDLNAGFGYYPLIAAAENRMCRIHAFETIPERLTLLKKNVATNKFAHAVYVENLQFQKHRGEIDVPVPMGEAYAITRGGQNDQVLNTPTTYDNKSSLDEYCAQRMIDHIELVRISGPGSELAVLQGGHQLIQDVKPVLILEKTLPGDMLQLKDVLRFYGYQAYHGTADGLIEGKPDLSLSDLNTTSTYFVHPNKYHLIAGMVVMAKTFAPASNDLHIDRENGLLVRDHVVSR